MNIGQAIKKLRQEKNMSQGDLQVATGLSQTALSQIERNVSKPSSKNLAKICKALNVPDSIVYIYALEYADVPDSKKDLFNQLYPEVQNMIKKIIME